MLPPLLLQSHREGGSVNFRTEEGTGRVLEGRSPFFILTLNVNWKDMPPLPAPTGPPLTPRQGCLAAPQGSHSHLHQGSQGTG